MRFINKWMVTALVLLLPLQVVAQSVTVGSDSGVGGDVIVLPVSFQPGADIAGVDFDIAFDATQFSAATASCVANTACPGAFSSCSINPAGTANIILAAGSACVAGVMGEITVTIDGAATFGSKPFDLTVVGLSDSLGVALDVNTIAVVNGAVEVLGPVFNGTPDGLNTMTVIQGQADPSGTLAIDNDNGGAGTTLTGSCAVTNESAVGTFTIVGGNTFSVLKDDPADIITVSCDSDSAVDSYTATLTCSPDGLAPQNFDLACNVTDGPQPVFNSVPAAGSTIQMGAANVGVPVTPATIEIDNDQGQTAGDPLILSVLNSNPNCTLTGDSAIQLDSDGIFSIEAGGPHDIEVISCDSSASSFGTPFTATLTCPHNALGSPAVYNIECSVGPQRPAVFRSDPVPGTNTDMTPGDDVLVDDVIPDQTLTFFNDAGADDADLGISCVATPGGDGLISVTPLSTDTILPGDDTSVTFSCDSSQAGSSTLTYTCDYESLYDAPTNPTGIGPTGQAIYDYACEVREAEVIVVSTPPSGSTLTEQVPGGGSGTFNVVFGVQVDEGVDGELLDCSVDDNVNFNIQSPVFPATIPSDGTLTVSVQGNDPGGVDELQTVLRCTYRDSSTGEAGAEWTYNLVMEIGSFATFRVTKDFVDGNPATVRVELHCNHGLPLIQGFNISNEQSVNFVLGSFDDGVPDCTITEVSADGYETTYYAHGQSSPTFDSDGCYFDNVGRGDVNICNITNEPVPVEIDITKEWIMGGSAGNVFAEMASVTVSSPTEIVDGYPCYESGESSYYGNYCKYLEFYGPETDTQTVMVYPHWEGVEVGIHEDVAESYIESENGCGGSVEIFPGQGAECTITNSVFFEGIPTLNQYGLALLALLMLGVGMVGFRRFS